jgi:predicted ester cyclase
MATVQMQSPVRRLFEEAFNQGNLAVVDEVVSANHVVHNAYGRAPHGAQGLKWLIVMFRSAFPDLHCTLGDEINQVDKVAARWIMHGTQKGTFLGNQPTGRPVEFHGMIFARMESEHIVEDRTLIDQMSILQQLGLIPPVARR